MMASTTQGGTTQNPQLKAHPEVDEDQVLGIDKYGQYYLNKKAVKNEDLPQLLQNIYSQRTIDQILYLKADKDLEYGRILDAMDIASKNGVRMVGAISDQQPGTVSSVAGDELQSGTTKTP